MPVQINPKLLVANSELLSSLNQSQERLRGIDQKGNFVLVAFVGLIGAFLTLFTFTTFSSYPCFVKGMIWTLSVFFVVSLATGVFFNISGLIFRSYPAFDPSGVNRVDPNLPPDTFIAQENVTLGAAIDDLDRFLQKKTKNLYLSFLFFLITCALFLLILIIVVYGAVIGF